MPTRKLPPPKTPATVTDLTADAVGRKDARRPEGLRHVRHAADGVVIDLQAERRKMNAFLTSGRHDRGKK